MKTPKYIDKLLRRRTRLANELMVVCVDLDDWLNKNGIDPDQCCWQTGCMIYTEPDAAENEVRKAIEKVR